MPDLPLDHLDPASADQLLRAFDVEQKIPRALEALGPIADRDVLLLDSSCERVVREIAALGGRLVVVATPDRCEALRAGIADLGESVRIVCGEPWATGLADESFDAVVSCWGWFRGPNVPETAEAERILRPGGRLLVLHDYGRDDASRLLDANRPEYTTWSRPRGPFLSAGFRIRVIHCWVTLDDLDETRDLLARSFGDVGAEVGAGLTRPRLSWNVAIYHRSKGDGAVADAAAGAASASAGAEGGTR